MSDKIIDNLSGNFSICLLSNENINSFLEEFKEIDKKHFKLICEQYGIKNRNITLIIEHAYIDAVYRDVYYNYWSRSHFDWPRYCKRLFLFCGEHEKNKFLDYKNQDSLQKDFVGAIVLRPSYSISETDHTFGRTLLDPFKMVDDSGKAKFIYLKTAEFQVHLLGLTLSVKAFPFLSQDGVAMRCAETAVFLLCDYASKLPLYSRILPSDIQDKLKAHSNERILPSRGLSSLDISFLVKEFGFSPMLYVKDEDEVVKDYEVDNKFSWHPTNFKDWFHYYIESGLPILSIIGRDDFDYKHAILVIGHGKIENKLSDIRKRKIGKLVCIDTADLYSTYILQDDNRTPYVEEQMDKFTEDDYSLDAYVVPLEKHAFLDASSAVGIFDPIIYEYGQTIEDKICELNTEYNKIKLTSDDQNIAEILEGLKISEDNPLTLRYYMTNSAQLKKHRINSALKIEDKLFYADTLMPKVVWVSEISTYKLSKSGYILGEIILDATASNKSKLNSIILFRLSNEGGCRLPNEEFKDFNINLANGPDKLSPLFSAFSNFEYSNFNNINKEGDCDDIR